MYRESLFVFEENKAKILCKQAVTILVTLVCQLLFCCSPCDHPVGLHTPKQAVHDAC